MDYSRIDALVNKKFAFISEFISAAGIANATYYKMMKSQNTNVETLEKISAALEVSPAYWWEDQEGQQVVSEPKQVYGYVSKRVYDELMAKWNEDRMRMNKQIEFLQNMLAEGKQEAGKK